MFSLFLPPFARVQSASGLMALLEDVCEELPALQACAGALAHSCPGMAEPAFSPLQLQILGGVIDQGWESLTTRIVALGGPRLVKAGLARLAPGRDGRKIRPRALVGAYGRCSHRLCQALQEARRISDATTAALLCDLIERLEEQLRLLDASSSNREHRGRRVLSFFFSC